MKKVIFFIGFMILLVIEAYAQKPPLDFKAIENWQAIDNEISVTNDGLYFGYLTLHTSIVHLNGGYYDGATFYLRSTKSNDWHLILPGVEKVFFTKDSKQAIFKLPGDTLCILRLGTSEKQLIPNVSDFQFSPAGWLAYRTKSNLSLLAVINPANMQKKAFTSVGSYNFNHKGDELLLKLSHEDKQEELALGDPATGKTKSIWYGRGAIAKVTFADDDAKIAFITSDPLSGDNSLWCYVDKTDSAKLIASGKTENISASLKVEADGRLSFNHQGSYLFFDLADAKPEPTPDPKMVKMDVWNYKYPHLRPSPPRKQFLAVMNVNDLQNLPAHIIQLENRDRKLIDEYGSTPQEFISSDVIVSDDLAEDTEYNMRRNDLQPQFYRINLQSGHVTSFKLPVSLSKIQTSMYLTFAPSGRWLVYFDMQKGKWYSYDVNDGTIRNITEDIHSSLYDEEVPFYPGPTFEKPAGIAGWLKDTGDVLIYDNDDIWQVDPTGKRSAINITNGYGVKHHIRFYIVETMRGERQINADQQSPFTSHSELLLSAYSLETKYNGFYKATITKPIDPKVLTFGPFRYCAERIMSGVDNPYSFAPIKVGDTGNWIVGRTTSSEAPNYFLTNDFKYFQPLTDLRPQRAYNWLSEELINWTTTDGRLSQGILYKPENFDPSKKYPMIIYFRQQYSNGMYNCPVPDYSRGLINIPYYVSRGYLVFLPDIYQTVGEPGESIVNSVVSATDYLTRTRPYVDSNRMGIQGESRGGWELNYLVTHSHKFAAAIDCYGNSDLISDYGSEKDAKYYYYYPYVAYNVNATLWERPDRYIKNSPVFNADKITTPLLIMHNRLDPAVPFSQGVEFFTALMELKKPAWLLQYDGEGHGVSRPETMKDWTIRMGQFFDHYLMNKPAPKWMTDGIVPWMKGIDDGLELEPGKTP